MTIANNLINILGRLPKGVKLAAVSKTHSVDEILEAYSTGHRCFAENKAQELATKYPLLPQDIEWHFIGHLQTNKVKFIAPFVSLIHSVDSLKLLKVINKEAIKNNRIIPVLLQFHIAEEQTKFGLNIEEAGELLAHKELKALNNIIISGVMGMATFTEKQDQVRREFKQLRMYFKRLQLDYFQNSPEFCEISMGMSDDYLVAIEEGSTIIRVGSSIFGARDYPNA
jgi:pyridoxal phosphate enzyme (YggS family)